MAGAGALDAAGVEAAGGWGLLLGAGCVEGAGVAAGVGAAAALGGGGRGVALTAGASVRSNLFSWLTALLDTRELEKVLGAAEAGRADATGRPPYPGAEGPGGCEGVLAWAGL